MSIEDNKFFIEPIEGINFDHVKNGIAELLQSGLDERVVENIVTNIRTEKCGKCNKRWASTYYSDNTDRVFRMPGWGDIGRHKTRGSRRTREIAASINTKLTEWTCCRQLLSSFCSPCLISVVPKICETLPTLDLREMRFFLHAFREQLGEKPIPIIYNFYIKVTEQIVQHVKPKHHSVVKLLMALMRDLHMT